MKKLFAFVAALLLVAPAFAADYYLENLNTTDIYVTSNFTPDSTFDTTDLKTGGWGDYYVPMIKFDISTLPAIAAGGKVSVWFYNHPPGDAAQPTQVQMGMLASDFTTSTTWNNSFGNSSLMWYSSTVRTVNVAAYGYWTEFDITDYYNYWKGGVANYGFIFIPVNTNNNFDHFSSSSTAVPWAEKPIVRITTDNSNPFLGFPLSTTLYPQGPYTVGKVTSVLDHQMDSLYVQDGAILSFTGELFQANSSYPATAPQACYPKASGAAWSSLLGSIYNGTLTSGTGGNCLSGVALNYDGHPGYDYVASMGTPVYAAAGGTVVNNAVITSGQNNTLCIPKGMNGVTIKGCAAWGAVGIDHGNGYITQYLHLSSISVTAGQVVPSGQQVQIGLSGDTGVPGQPHLHFEVLRLRSGATNDYQPASYATVDPYGFDTSKGYTDYMTTFNNNVPNVCLWKSGCKFQ
ncbi:MAG: peptidoglycan DD-metalloendopeptidase family protein [Minisyncoccota bacterium]